MSYCRWNGDDSEVYVIAMRDPLREQNILRCFCGQVGDVTTTRTSMIAHLRNHQDRGTKVPQRAFERLAREIREEGDEI